MNGKFTKLITFLLGKKKEGWIDAGLLVIRVVIGIFMLTHGWQKIANFDALKTTFPDPIGLGSSLSLILIIFAEFGCSLLLILGLFTRLAVLPLMFGMIVAGFITHGGAPLGERELPLFYLATYIALFFTGPGKYSLDTFLRKGWQKYISKK